MADFGACRAITADGAAVLRNGSTLIENLRDGDWRSPTKSDVSTKYQRNDLHIVDESEANTLYVLVADLPRYDA